MKEYKPSDAALDHTPAVREVDWDEVRKARNQKLTDTDWVNTGARLLTFEERHSLCVYRQALRDMPQQSTLVWPEESSFLKKDN